METKDLVFEIGVEELPSPYFDCVYKEKNRLEKILKEKSLVFDEFEIFITPRRIVFSVKGIPVKQEEKEEVVKGPVYDKSFDDAGNPTKALEGFLRSKGIDDVSSVFKLEEKKKVRAAVKVLTGGNKAIDVLAEALPGFVTAFTFPRNMGWNDSGVRFPRPIRWLMCVYGEELVPVEAAGLKAGKTSYGHRYVSPGAIEIESAASFFKQLSERKIILSETERYDAVSNALEDLCSSKGWTSIKFDAGLLASTARLSENPYPVTGSFREEYLSLPSDVLATCMKKHQKIFACYDTKGKLVNSFIAVLDGQRKRDDLIQSGYENVLESRLKDAAFFIKEDTKAPFEKFAERMNEIAFLGNLGTFEDKVARMISLADTLGQKAEMGSDNFKLSAANIKSLKEAARFCKADLVSNIVYEFPELQGIAGREYLMNEGKEAELYTAVSDHYLPLSLSDDIDTEKYSSSSVALTSALLGIIDRVDTVVGALGQGIGISGSEDPYALRRASGCIIKIIRAFQINLSLSDIVDASIQSFGEMLKVDADELRDKVLALLKDRLVYEAGESAGSVEGMIFEAVCETSFDDIADVFQRTEELKSFFADSATKDDFVNAVKMVERTKNITRKFSTSEYGDVDPALLKDAEEKKLFESYVSVKEKIKQEIVEKRYKNALKYFVSALNNELDAFFDKVLVNVDDEHIRVNRQRLLSNIHLLITSDIAELSKVHGL